MRKITVCLAAAAALLIAQRAGASAAELKVFSTIGVQAALEELTPAFEKETGDKLNITWATAVALTKRVQAGETPDVMILTSATLGALAKDGKAAVKVTPIASSGIAVVVKAGAAKPDIATPEAFKQTLLNAKSIAYSDPAAGGASGVYIGKMLTRMGIADAMKAKTHFPPPNGNSAHLVVNGEAEIAMQQTPEVMGVKGIDMVGTLPGDLNNITHFAAGVGATTKQANAAHALINFLTSPQATAVFKAHGLTPG